MKIAILAPFDWFDPAYSLSHVVCDQARALIAAGHDVIMWTMAKMDHESSLDVSGDLHDIIKPTFTMRQHTHVPEPETVEIYRRDLSECLCRDRPDVVISHDTLFQSAYSNFAAALHLVAGSVADSTKAWLHYAHSAVTDHPVRPSNRFHRTLPRDARHVIVYPNASMRGRVATYFRCRPHRVFPCANVHDVRTLWRLSPPVKETVTTHRLHKREFVQVYPFCSTRWKAKGVDHVVRIFEKIKQMGHDVCCVLVNSNRNGTLEIDEIRDLAPELGDDLVFTSLEHDDWTGRTPNTAVQELMRFANVFVFPTKAEACPLVMAEAQAAGCLCVVNADVPALNEVSAPGTIAAHFGLGFGDDVKWEVSLNKSEKDPETQKILREWNEKHTGDDAYEIIIDGIAGQIVDTLQGSPLYWSKRFAMTRYSWETHAKRLEQIIEEVASCQ